MKTHKKHTQFFLHKICFCFHCSRQHFGKILFERVRVPFVNSEAFLLVTFLVVQNQHRKLTGHCSQLELGEASSL